MNSTTDDKEQHWYKSPWLIGWLFLIVTVLAVNGYMIMQSINNFPGLVVDDFYERGQDYEENINKKLENNNKWVPEFTLSDFTLNEQASVLFRISDKQGQPAVVEKITLFAYRPSNSKKDFSLPMTLSADKSSADKKIYQANITFETKGKWDLLASVIIDGIEVNYAKSISVKD